MATQINPHAPAVERFRLHSCGRIDVATGVYKRISPVTGDVETVTTREGLERMRRQRRRKAQSILAFGAALEGFGSIDDMILSAPVAQVIAYRRLPGIPGELTQRCAGQRRRQERVRR